MEEIWQRIEKWLMDNEPDVLKHLRPGATEGQLLATEDALGVHFPEDMRTSYLLHDGCNNPYGFIDGEDFFSLKDILHQWQNRKELFDKGEFSGVRNEPDDGVRSDWWNPLWIPLTRRDTGGNTYLDLDPALEGKPGQIISIWKSFPERTLLRAESFTDWFREFADALEAGEYTTSEEYDGLVSIDDV
jgi:cell wall assembly regulator SMI1